MAGRGTLARALSTAASSTTSQASRGRITAVAGMRVDAGNYTATGGSGLDGTALSSSFEEASAKTRAVYRHALRNIPEMRRNFSIMEDKKMVQHVVRDLFERHKYVSDPKIVDMLVFKAIQELHEIREQWKSRHHVYSYIQRFSEKELRQQAAKKLEQDPFLGDSHDQRQMQMLSDWRSSGLVPQEVITWAQFLKWKQEEDEKFKNFAVEKKLFSKEELERNANSQQSCAMM